MKVRSAIKSMCKDCYIVRRGKTRYVYCKSNAKHKQRQGYHTFAGDMCTMCIAQHLIPTKMTSTSPSSFIKPLSLASNIFPTYKSLSSSFSSLTISSNTNTDNNSTNNNNNTISSKTLKSIKTLGISSLFY